MKGCYWCGEAKRFLKNNHYSFVEFDMTDDREMRNRIQKLTNHKTVPIIFDARYKTPKFIGGYSELREYLKKPKKPKKVKKPKRKSSRKLKKRR